MNGAALTLSIDGFLARLLIGREGERAPSLGPDLLSKLDECLDELEARAAAGEVGAVLLEGRGSDGFVVGSELAWFEAAVDARAGAELALRAQAVLRRLERLPIPTVALLEGACLGGGLELAMACSHRLAAASDRTRLGLPEVRIGLIPGFGGTVRLPRLVGARAALPLLLTGRPADAAEAKRIGLIDEVVPPRQLRARAERLAASWAGRPPRRARRGLPRRLVEDTAPGRRLVLRRSARRFLKTLDPENPAPRRALEAVAEGLALPLERAFRREARVFGRLLAAPASRALVHAARLSQEVTHGVARPVEPVVRAAVLGAGTTGTLWSYLLTRAGVAVRLKDRKRSAMAAGVAMARTLVGRAASRAAVEPATGFGGFGVLDLVVVAVGDRPEAVRLALREAREHSRASCLIALAASGPVEAFEPDPYGRCLRLHAAEPPDAFPFVEVGVPTGTRSDSLSRILDVARRAGVTTVVTGDVSVGLLPRLLGAYYDEALRLLDEGAGAEGVDRVLERFGFASGPFRRMDAVGLERALRLVRALHPGGDPAAIPTAVERLAAAGGTFYRYRGGRARGVEPSLPAPVGSTGEAHEALVRDRVLFRVANEAARAEAEGLASARAIDLASLGALGFPRRRGGVLWDARRADPVERAERFAWLEARFGPRFTPAPGLLPSPRPERQVAGHAVPGPL